MVPDLDRGDDVGSCVDPIAGLDVSPSDGSPSSLRFTSRLAAAADREVCRRSCRFGQEGEYTYRV